MGSRLLTALDETMRHQAPLTFAEVASTDHRFFDRVWFCAYDPAGAAGLITGMGAYTNMNVFDGFVAIQHDGRQHNLRLSRPLRPDVDIMGVGPLRVEVVAPMRVLRLVLEANATGDAFDLTWTALNPARAEAPHLGRLDGRTYQDYLRFSQVGSVDGHLVVGGVEFTLDRWFGARDHSWGVRRGVGGFEPFTGSMPPEASGSLFLWVAIHAGDTTALVWAAEDGDGRPQSLDGSIWSGGHERHVVDLQHEITFRPGGRAYEHARVVLTDDHRDVWVIDADPLITAWAYRGTGYDRGWTDGKGLGAWRGESAVEADVYGVTDPEDVVFPDGSVQRPPHREQPVRISINGVAGVGHLPVITAGPVTRYGLQ
jgi:hypothetical protein